MFRKKKIKIKWEWRYAEAGSLEPDKLNRWSVIGYIEVPSKKLFKKGDSTRIPIPYAVISQKGSSAMPYESKRFCCMFCHITDIASGMSYSFVSGDVLEEVMAKAEEKINFTFNCLRNSL